MTDTTDQFQPLRDALAARHSSLPLHDHHDHGYLVIESEDGDLYLKVSKGSASQRGIEDARLIVAAVNAAPALLAEVERLRAALESPLQGGMSNDELREAWSKKLPGVEPKDNELTAFALGVEVGNVGRDCYFAERNSARDAWRERVKQCEALAAEVERLTAELAAAPAEGPELPPHVCDPIPTSQAAERYRFEGAFKASALRRHLRLDHFLEADNAVQYASRDVRALWAGWLLRCQSAAPAEGARWLPGRPPNDDGTFLVADAKRGLSAPRIGGVIYNNPGTPNDWQYDAEITHHMPHPAAPTEAPNA